MTIRHSTAGLAVLLLLSSTAIGSLHGGKVAIQSEAGIVMGTTDSVESCLDPALAYDFFGWQIIQSLGCGLVEHKVNASGSPDQYLPSLATSWNVSDDGLAWTFNLRQGVKYDNGTEFNATHVKYTFDRGLGIDDPNGAWLGIGYGDIIKNVAVISKYTIRFNLNIPFAPFLSLIALPVAFIVDPAYAPMNQTVTYNAGNPRASNPMGLGPYVLKNWTRVAGRDIEIDLQSNPNYWNAGAGLPRTKNIVIKMYSSATTLALAIFTKEVDVAYRQLTNSDMIAAKNNAALKDWEGNGSFIQYLVLQEKYAPFNVTAIRKAVGAAVNRTALVQTVFLGQAQNLYSLIPSGMLGHTDAFLNLGDPNYTRTRELLGPLGYNESNKLTFTLTYETSGHYPQSQQVAQVLKASIEASGVITVNLQGLEWPAMGARRNAGTMEAFIYGWYPDYIDPDDYTYWFVHSAGASWLNYHYSNATVDELIEAGRERLTATERAAVYSQIQSLIAEDCPIVPLYQSLTQAVSVVGIEGIYTDLTELLRLWYIVRASGTIYIRANGSIDPPTALISTLDNVTYTLTGNIYSDADGIVVERDDIVVDGAGFTIEGTRADYSNGIFLYERSNVTIQDTGIKSFIYGILVHTSANNRIFGNNITNCNQGIVLSYPGSDGNSISRNTVTASFGNGIWLGYSSNNSIIGNTVTDNYVSIGLDYLSSNNSIIGNTMTNNDYGIELNRFSEGFCSNNTLCHNNFVNNTEQVVDWAHSDANVWDNGCEGNYWSNYDGTDLDNDGVGDTSFPWEGVDNCPLMNVYWNPSDINHDLKVDMRDIGISGKAFNTGPGDVLWNPHADITGLEPLVADEKVDMRDISLIARHFGEHYP